jgi:hypothetical protein
VSKPFNAGGRSRYSELKGMMSRCDVVETMRRGSEIFWWDSSVVRDHWFCEGSKGHRLSLCLLQVNPLENL